MKLADLGLKTKPATKYFDGGYVKFSTLEKELYYGIVIYDDKRNPFVLEKFQPVNDSIKLHCLLNIKTKKQVLEA